MFTKLFNRWFESKLNTTIETTSNFVVSGCSFYSKLFSGIGSLFGDKIFKSLLLGHIKRMATSKEGQEVVVATVELIQVLQKNAPELSLMVNEMIKELEPIIVEHINPEEINTLFEKTNESFEATKACFSSIFKSKEPKDIQ